MLFTIFSSAILAGLSVAQYSSLPSCAKNCATQQFTSGSYDGCGTDPECICSNQDFLGTISCCLVDACDAADQASAIKFAQKICEANGATVASTATCSTAASSTGTAKSTAAAAAATSTGSATGTAASASSSAAWAPRETAAVGVGLLGGLAAAGLALL